MGRPRKPTRRKRRGKDGSASRHRDTVDADLAPSRPSTPEAEIVAALRDEESARNAFREDMRAPAAVRYLERIAESRVGDRLIARELVARAIAARAHEPGTDATLAALYDDVLNAATAHAQFTKGPTP